MQTIRKNVEIDEREVATLQEDRERFLIQALDSYLQCLRRGDLHDLRISRVLALWFDNSSHKQINKMMAVSLECDIDIIVLINSQSQKEVNSIPLYLGGVFFLLGKMLKIG